VLLNQSKWTAEQSDDQDVTVNISYVLGEYHDGELTEAQDGLITLPDEFRKADLTRRTGVSHADEPEVKA